jgi:hypothetical protein
LPKSASTRNHFESRANNAIDRDINSIHSKQARSFIFANFFSDRSGYHRSCLERDVWRLDSVRASCRPVVVEAPAVTPAETFTSKPYSALFDPGFFSGSTLVSLAQSSPLKSNFESIPAAPSAAIAEPENFLPMPTPAVPKLAENIPLPPPRPTKLGMLESHSPSPASSRLLVQQNRKPVLPATPPDNRTFFEKIFGMRYLRALSSHTRLRKMVFLAMHAVSHPTRRPATIDGPPYMMSQRIPSTCTMDRDWKRTRASAIG